MKIDIKQGCTPVNLTIKREPDRHLTNAEWEAALKQELLGKTLKLYEEMCREEANNGQIPGMPDL